MSFTAVLTLFRARYMLSKAHGNFKQTPQCAYKGSKKFAIWFLFEEKKWNEHNIRSHKENIIPHVSE